MTREDILPIARKHGFGGFEVGVRMVGLINEILAIAMSEIDINDLHRHLNNEKTQEAE